MSSNVAKDFKEQVLNSEFSQSVFSTGASDNSSSTFTVDKPNECVPPIEKFCESVSEAPTHPGLRPEVTATASSSSSYTLACDQSMYSRQIDRWFQGPVLPTDSASVQLSRVPLVQRSTLISSGPMDTSGIWYLLAMILPLFSVNNTALWRCAPGNVLNAADVFVTNLRRICAEATVQVQRLAEDQLARDYFATLMDIVLVIYAIGFLVLSLYQASVFG